jgi:cytoskeletal protein CcmA (bactofilin family)
MSIARIKSKFSDLLKANSHNESFSKSLNQISANFKSTPTIIAKDLKIEGQISGSNVIEIEGNIIGAIRGNSVVVHEEGNIEGEIIAESLTIRGKFNGTIRAKNINIASKAHITGYIEYGYLSVEDGAFIDGQFKQLSAKI